MSFLTYFNYLLYLFDKLNILNLQKILKKLKVKIVSQTIHAQIPRKCKARI